MNERAMSEIKNDLKALKEHIVQQKDELRVQLNLASMEAKEDLAIVEEKWEDFLSQMKRVFSNAEEMSEDAANSIKHMGDDLKKSYQKIRDSISS